MELYYASITDFENKFNNQDMALLLYETKCSCGAYREMQISQMKVIIGEYRIDIFECPIMVCNKCGNTQLCPNIPQEIYTSYFRMQKTGHKYCKMTMRSNIRFSYAEEANYVYDSRDICIPGLGIDLDPTNPEGFSCPVYFDRKVLNSFFTDDDYELDFFSESYGTIAKIGTDGWPYEWNIVFGINQNNKVIFFLGDLDQIDANDRAVRWLQSYNVSSDHNIVNTELYQAQLNCQFSDPIKEKRIIALRNAFFKKMNKKYGVNLFHLEDEVEQKGKSIEKPINFSEREIKENIIILDGVLNEGIDCSELRKLYQQLVASVPRNINELKTRKLLQAIIALSAGENDAKQIVAPLFYLNDLRVCFAHLIPKEEVEQYKNNIVAAFNLTSFNEYKKLYDTLIDKLYYLYRYLNVTEI